MANDRLYFKCKNCGEHQAFAKYYPGNYGVWFPEKMAEWVKTHMGCSDNIWANDLGGDSCFTVFAESDPEFDRLTTVDKIEEQKR